MFQKHTSEELVELFTNRPFQCQDPSRASIIFLSSDANYSPEISRHRFFNYILEYQQDGVAFWLKYGFHHPFLLPDYPFEKTKAGVPFHRNFAKMGLGSEYGKYVSFLELLDVPTIGNKSENRALFYELASFSHLSYIERLMLDNSNKLFFLSNGVLKDLLILKKQFPVFSWLDVDATFDDQCSVFVGSNKIKRIYHFSSSHIHRQIGEISDQIDAWLSGVR